METKKKVFPKMARWVVVTAVIAAVVIAAGVIFSIGSGKTTFDAVSSLKDIMEISEISTAKYMYNSITEVKSGKTVKYHVSYCGMVEAGFSLEDVKIRECGDKIVITIPEIKIINCSIDQRSLDWIFTKQKYDTEKVLGEALDVCYKDIQAKAAESDALFTIAQENAIETMKALIKPIEERLDDGKTIEIVVAEEREEIAQ